MNRFKAPKHINRWLKEPLLHFALLGLLIFAVSAWREQQRPAANAVAQIEITAGTIAWLSEGFTNQWHRAPDGDELRGLVNDHVREEVLYREALALGLDGNDTIVRRRLAQKMEFLGQDIATAAEPDEAALRKFFEENSARYAKAARISFRHVYFSKDRRGDRLEADAREALAALAKGADEETLGDPFLREHEFAGASETDIASALGRDFAALVVTLPAGEWRGPVASSYGVHLVQVLDRAGPQSVEFDAVREPVLRDFSETRRLAANADFFRRLKERYLISVDEKALADVATPSTRTAAK
ncbi:MAG TPA: peptidylprolyl isomerase [Chthoniobacterales bacterium]|nr:peptidylprolyl isomerase [Chthoniobacterales bacterium]